jgi:toxin ParE1/3/4
MPSVFRPSQAYADLMGIALHIAEQNPADADRWLEMIDVKCTTLARMPEMGRKRFELSAGVRRFAVGNYVIFYRPCSNGIEIIRVLHGSRDIPAIFE